MGRGDAAARATEKGLLALLALALVASLAVGGCGSGNSATAGSADAGAHRIGFLASGNRDPRSEARIRSEVEEHVQALCRECQVLFEAAGGNAPEQRRQAGEVLERGAEALVLDPVGSAAAAGVARTARAASVPLVAIGRPLGGIPADIQVSFSRVGIGTVQAESLSHKLELDGSTNGPIVLINGDPADSEAKAAKKGVLHGYVVSDVTIVKAYSAPGGSSREAEVAMRGAIGAIGGTGFEGVNAASDQLAGGAIEAMESAGVDPAEKPTVGVGATVAGVRRILDGRQYMTVYMPARLEAVTAAEIGVDLAEGEEVSADIREQEAGGPGARSILLEPVAVTRDNLQQTVLADGTIDPSALCAPPLSATCKKVGISP